MDFQKSVKALVDYIKSNATKENPWVVLPQREIARIAGVSSYYCKKLTEELRMHPDIYMEVDGLRGASNRPYRYRILSEKEKEEMGISASQFYYLSQEEINIIEEKLKSHGYATKYHERLDWMSWISMLVGLSKDRQWTEYSAERTATLMVMPISKIRDRIEKMELMNLLVFDETRENYRLAFLKDDNEKAHSEKKKVSKKSSDSNHETKETQKIVLPVVEVPEIEVQPVTEASIVADLLSNMKDFRNYFDDAYKHAIEECKTGLQNMEIGQKALDKLMKENELLRSELDKAKRDVDVLTSSLEKAQKIREQFLVDAQDNFTEMFGQISNLMSAYVQLPKWNLNNPVHSAKLQKQVTEIVSGAIDKTMEIKP